MVQLRRVTVLLLVAQIMVVSGQEATSPEDTIVIPLKFYVCDNFQSKSDNSLDISIDGDENNKAADVVIHLAEEFTEFWEFQLKFAKWENDDWVEKFHNMRGKVCDFVDKYASTFWEKFRSQSSPALPDGCPVEPGHYTVSDFRVSKEESQFPVPGIFQITLKIFNELDDEVLCNVGEIEVI